MKTVEQIKTQISELEKDRDQTLAEFNRLGQIREQLQARANACVGAIESLKMVIVDDVTEPPKLVKK